MVLASLVSGFPMMRSDEFDRGPLLDLGLSMIPTSLLSWYERTWMLQGKLHNS